MSFSKTQTKKCLPCSMILTLNTATCSIVNIDANNTELDPVHLWEEINPILSIGESKGLVTESEAELTEACAINGFNDQLYLETLGKHALHEIQDFFSILAMNDFLQIRLDTSEFTIHRPGLHGCANDTLEFYACIEPKELDKILTTVASDNGVFFNWLRNRYYASDMLRNASDFVEAITGKDVGAAVSAYLNWQLHQIMEREDWGDENPFQNNLIETMANTYVYGDFASNECYHKIVQKAVGA